MPNLSSSSSTVSPSLRQRISTAQLQPGMFLVRILDSWWKSPFFRHRRLLKTMAEVEQLKRSGIREVEIDTSKGIGLSEEPEVVADGGSVDAIDELKDSSEQMHSVSNETKVRFSAIDEEPELEGVSEETKTQQELVGLRDDAMVAVEEAFEGVKTGQPLPQPTLQALAKKLVEKAVAHPGLLSQILLIDSLKQFDKPLYAHVLDTAVYSILVGLQLGLDDGKLEQIGVAGLLHDVGYIRLPQNVVKAGRKQGRHSSLLKQHVTIGIALLQRQAQFSPNIVRMVGEHHSYQDGSGYPPSHGGHSLMESSQLLGVMDYFDELLTGEGTSRALPAALAIRKLYKEAQTGKFPILHIEALIRTLGVFPVGTVVQLSTQEQGVVIQPNPDVSVKPIVKIFRNKDGEYISDPWLCDLAEEGSQSDDVHIVKVLESSEYSIDPREFF